MGYVVTRKLNTFHRTPKGVTWAFKCCLTAARAPPTTRRNGLSATTDMLLADCLVSFCCYAIYKTPLPSGRITFSLHEMLAYCSTARPGNLGGAPISGSYSGAGAARCSFGANFGTKGLSFLFLQHKHTWCSVSFLHALRSAASASSATWSQHGMPIDGTDAAFCVAGRELRSWRSA